MGTALIPTSPEAWAPYPLYTTELTPAISHAAFTYPAATAAAAAALHAQVSSPRGRSRTGESEGSEWSDFVPTWPLDHACLLGSVRGWGERTSREATLKIRGRVLKTQLWLHHLWPGTALCLR